MRMFSCRTREDDSMINKVDNTSSFRRTGIVAQLDYNRTFGKHGVSALAFYEQYESNDEMVLPTRFQSVNGWFGYNYDKRYGIDVIGAYQGSHKFGPGHKFGFFPTISAGWTVSNESFWKDTKKIVPYLKLKASYGQVGNSSGVDALLLQGTYVAAKRSLYHRGKHGNKAWRIHSGYTSKSRIDLGES